jgi:DUF4097 and DUF4098 domain-containing protein YvlB
MSTFETPGKVSLQIRLQGGNVVVTTSDEPRTTVDLVAVGRKGQDALDDVVVTCDERGGRHVVRVEQKDKIRWGPLQISWGGGFEVHVTCPRGTDLELSGGSTSLRAEGDLGDVAARTASGDVRLGTVLGRLEVKTASGDVSVTAIAKEASLVTVSGDAEVGRVDGSLTARAVSGDLRVRTLAGRLTLSTTSGDVEIGAVAGGELRVQTVSGDVRVGVARGTPVWIDAASVSGDLESELGLGDVAPLTEAEGSVVPLHLKTVSGDVSIVRAGVAVST